MRYWFVAFAIALVVVLGHAVGLFGLLLAGVAFGVVLFLVWADQLGFGGAWEAFGFDRSDTPGSGPEHRDRFAALLQDRGKVAKALTLTLGLTALWLILPEESVLIGVIVAIGWAAQRILSRRPALPAASPARPQAPLPAPTRLAAVETPKPVPTSIEVPADVVHTQPAASTIVLESAASPPADTATAKSKATVSFMVRAPMSSASSLALLLGTRYRKQRVRRLSKRPKRQAKSRTSLKPTRHVPLHLKLPLGRRQIRRPRRTLQAGSKLPSRRPSKD
jgi:hypothetical protein